RTELWIWHLDRNDRGQAFTRIVAGGGDLVLLGQAFLLDIVVQVTSQRRTEAGQVSTAITLRDVIGKAEQVLVEAVIPLQCDFDADAIITLNVEVKHLIDRRLVGVQVSDECAQATLVLKQLLFAAALIAQDDTNTRVEKRQLAQSLGQNVPAEMNI